MWRALLLLLVACESKDDFPSKPQAIEWWRLELVSQEGTLDGTGYRIAVPKGAAPTPVGNAEVSFVSTGLKVTLHIDSLAVDPDDAIPGDTFEATPIVSRETTEAGWVVVFDQGRGVLSYTYVDDGALTCKAESLASSKTDPLLAICRSVRATTPLAKPLTFPEGASPRQLRIGSCHIALHHVRQLEPAPPKAKKRRTKSELEAETKRVEALDAAYRARRERCVNERWGRHKLACLTRLDHVDGVSGCDVPW